MTWVGDEIGERTRNAVIGDVDGKNKEFNEI